MFLRLLIEVEGLYMMDGEMVDGDVGVMKSGPYTVSRVLEEIY